MAIHVILLFIVIFVSFGWNKKNSRTISFVCAFLFFSLIAFRDGGCTDDALVYKPIYDSLKEARWKLVSWVEPFSWLEINTSLLLGWSVKGWYFIIAFISAFFLGMSLPFFIHNRKEFTMYWIGLFLLQYFGCATVIIQVQAAAMLMYIVVLQLKGRNKLSLLLMISLCLVHSASVLMIPLWFMIKYRDRIVKLDLHVMLPWFILILSLLGAVKSMILLGQNFIPEEYSYIVTFIVEGNTDDKKGFLIFFSFACYLLLLKSVNCSKLSIEVKTVIICVMTYLCLYFSSFGVSMLHRVAYYLVFFSPFIFAYIRFKNKEAILLSMFMIAYFIFTLFHFFYPFFEDYSGSVDLLS